MLRGVPVTIGSDPVNSLAFSHESIAAFHCVVEMSGSGYRVRDLGAPTGTLVNGQPIKQHELRSGDAIKIGALKLDYVQRQAAVDGKPAGPPVKAPGASMAPTARNAPPPPVAGKPLQFADDVDEAPAPQRHRGGGEEVMTFSDGDMPPVKEIAAALGIHLRTLGELLGHLPATGISQNDVTLINAKSKRTPRLNAGNAQDIVKAGNDGLFFLCCLLVACLRMRATDLHVEPKSGTFSVRARVDGAMLDLVQLHPWIGHRVQRVVKVLSEQDIAKPLSVQEGQFAMDVPGRRVHYRVSFTPSKHGQKLALRILDEAVAPLYLRDLGMPTWMQEDLQRLIRQDSGVILVSGPTGSGKTTTLYALIREIDRSARNVVTLESPVEFEIEGITQLPINEMHGQSYATILPSVLRQDPDVLLVGEVREKDTARIVMQAAMTGHLVFSTIHARNSIGTIFRLLDLGVEPHLMAAGLNRALTQRLVRQLCEHCRHPRRLSEHETKQFADMGIADLEHIYAPVGCGACMTTGYLGRRAIYELLIINDKVRDVILSRPQIVDLHEAAKQSGFSTLRESALRLVAEGITSMEEVERVAGES